MQDFAGKVAVITGAASGIGKALTEKCIAEGMHVVMADIEEAVLEKAAAELQATTNNQVLPIVANVAMEAELRKVRDEAVETLGAYTCFSTMLVLAVAAIPGTQLRRTGTGCLASICGA